MAEDSRQAQKRRPCKYRAAARLASDAGCDSVRPSERTRQSARSTERPGVHKSEQLQAGGAIVTLNRPAAHRTRCAAPRLASGAGCNSVRPSERTRQSARSTERPGAHKSEQLQAGGAIVTLNSVRTPERRRTSTAPAKRALGGKAHTKRRFSGTGGNAGRQKARKAAGDKVNNARTKRRFSGTGGNAGRPLTAHGAAARLTSGAGCDSVQPSDRARQKGPAAMKRRSLSQQAGGSRRAAGAIPSGSSPRTAPRPGETKPLNPATIKGKAAR